MSADDKTGNPAQKEATNRANAAESTLWDRIQRVLHNNPFVVLILLIVISATGLKDLIEGVQKVINVFEEHKRSKQEETTILPCSDLGRIKSPTAVEEETTRLTFTNSSSQDLQISWINENGVGVPYKSLPPTTQVPQDSFPGHVWLLSNGHGCINLVVKGTAASAVELTPEGVKARLIRGR